MQKPKTPVKKPAPQPTVLKNGKPVKLVKSSISEMFRNGGSVGKKKSGVDSSTTNTTMGEMPRMSKGGKVMPKKAMGGKMGKKSC